MPTKSYLLALKILAVRPDKDFEDACLLCKSLGLQTVEEIKEVFYQFFPESYFDAKRLFLQKL